MQGSLTFTHTLASSWDENIKVSWGCALGMTDGQPLRHTFAGISSKIRFMT